MPWPYIPFFCMHRFIVALLALLIALPAFAQDRFAFSPGVTYDAAIPAPADFLGYELGERFTVHARMLDYFEALAASSDKITLHDYGHTHEGRRLIYVVVTSTENQGRIEDIRTNNLRLADPSDAEAEALIPDHPAIHWMSYNVHGNEPSSTEAAMQVAYRLVAGQDAETQRILNESVVILDPCINPDGRDRYVYWYTTMHSKHLNTNPDDVEHREPWPGGRTNHYWFDLNRDWVWLVHPESQGRIAAYQQWLPQVHIDYHEQGFNNNYFTHPGTTPRNLNLPEAHDTWAERYGRADAAAFDEHRISYFTGEAFDFFYPGYGSSYPSVMGGIGMLREQGGHSRGGRAVETNDGYILSLRQRIFDHYLTSVAGMNTTVENREDLLRYFRDALTPAKTNKSRTQAYLLPNHKRNFTHSVINLLITHGVTVEQAEADFSVPDARGYQTGQPANRTFEAGTFIIRTDQARHLLINTLMQRRMAIEDSVMYDMGTWSIPLAYNLDAAWTERPLSVNTVRVETPLPTAGSVTNAGAHYAYVIEWSQQHAPKALAMLWKAGYQVRSIQRPFTSGEQTFSRGSLVVLMGRNLKRVDQAAAEMQHIAQAAGVEILGLDSGFTEDGIDLASGRSVPLKNPSVALLIDPPFNSYTTGQLWFLFEEWTHFPINRIRLDDLRSLKLSDYDVLLLPGSWGNLGARIDSAQVARIKAWVHEGGTVISTEGSALFLTADASEMTGIEQAKAPEEEEEAEVEDGTLEDPYVGFETRQDLEDLDYIPGAAFLAHLDVTHPLAYGMPPHLYSLKFGTAALEPSTDAEVAGYYAREADQLLVSGYTAVKNRERLAGKAFAMQERMGRGKVILLLDNTQYRMFWVGPARLMQNAVMLGPSM